jgi:CRP-like cAMP-binding protein
MTKAAKGRPKHVQTGASYSIISKQATALVLSMPILQGLSKSAQKRVTDCLEIIQLQQGTSFLIEGTAPDDMYFVCAGEVSLTSEQEMVTISKAPTIIGLLSLLDGGLRSASAHAFTDCVLARLSRQDFETILSRSSRLTHNIVEYLGREVRTLHSATQRRRAQFDDVFNSPNARLVPGPYGLKNCDLFCFVMAGPEKVLERLLPEGTRLMDGMGGRDLLIFGFYPNVKSQHEGCTGDPFSYAESALGIPILDADGRPSLYCPEQYPDNYMAIVMGRELYGFPRRYGRTSFEPSYIDLDIDRVMVLRAGWSAQDEVSPDAFAEQMCAAMTTSDGLSPHMRKGASVMASVANAETTPGATALPLTVLNQVPSTLLTAGAEFRINELIEVPFIVESLSNFRTLTNAHVRHFTTRWLASGKCIAGFRFRADLTIGMPIQRRKLPTVGEVTLARRLWTDVKQWLP